MAQSSITLESPDGTKTVEIKLQNDGYLYYYGSDGETAKATRVVKDPQYTEPQYD
ncbi:hypothetical protein [Fodinibius sp. Rm-B-1B1-1]|uniref:hypothetical protein n=1 Tax=Fodinibius alkaliphilus TaxID=3140241 RepID=UPI00315AC573